MMLVIRSRLYGIRIARLMDRMQRLTEAYAFVLDHRDGDGCEAIQAEIDHVRGKLSRLFASWGALVETRGAV